MKPKLLISAYKIYTIIYLSCAYGTQDSQAICADSKHFTPQPSSSCNKMKMIDNQRKILYCIKKPYGCRKTYRIRLEEDLRGNNELLKEFKEQWTQYFEQMGSGKRFLMGNWRSRIPSIQDRSSLNSKNKNKEKSKKIITTK